MFGNIYLKAIRDTFFLVCGLWSGKGQRAHNFLVDGDIQQKQEIQNFGLKSKVTPLKGNPDLHIRKTQMSVVDLSTEMIEWVRVFSLL